VVVFAVALINLWIGWFKNVWEGTYTMSEKLKFPFSADVLLEFFNVKYCIFVAMDPWRFNEVAVEPGSSGLYREAVNAYKQKIMNGQHVASLFLSVKDGECIGHEGRHRAQAAAELGIRHVPVSFEVYQTYIYDGYDEMRAIDHAFGKGTEEWLKLVGKYQVEKMILPKCFGKEGNFVSATINKQRVTYAEACGKPIELTMRINAFEGIFNITRSERYCIE